MTLPFGRHKISVLFTYSSADRPVQETILVVAPHPDDETLGCGGLLLKKRKAGARLFWLIVTEMASGTYAAEQIDLRKSEIDRVRLAYDFEDVLFGHFPTTRLDAVPKGDLVANLSNIIRGIQPTEVFLPYGGDVHSDHQAVFEAGIACTKWFRQPSIERTYVYETLSETEQGIDPDRPGFRPNVFVDISEYLDRKVEIANIYGSEMSSHPFPRSEGSIRALAGFRGATAGFVAAEAFILLRSRIL